MLCVVRKTSTWLPPDDEDAVPPCDGARPARVERWDRRTFATPAEHDERFPDEPWLSQGARHGTWAEGGQSGIERLIPFHERVWVADVPDVWAFAATHGQLVASPPREWVLNGEALPELEIYDDARE